MRAVEVRPSAVDMQLSVVRRPVEAVVAAAVQAEEPYIVVAQELALAVVLNIPQVPELVAVVVAVCRLVAGIQRRQGLVEEPVEAGYIEQVLELVVARSALEVRETGLEQVVSVVAAALEGKRLALALLQFLLLHHQKSRRHLHP